MPDAATYKHILVQKKGVTLEVWLNRPHARNALSLELIAEWNEVLDRADDDDEVRVITLRGKGPVFSAGHDLKEDRTSAQAQRTRTLDRGWYCRKTMIAGVHGYVGPAAHRLLAPFDFVLSADDTRFSFEHLRVDTHDPGGNIMAFLLPMRVIKQCWLMGGWMDAETARQMHYVQRVVPFAELSAEVGKWSMAAGGLTVAQIRGYKESIHRMYEIMGLAGIIAIGNHVTEYQTPAGGPNEFLDLVRAKGMKEALRSLQGNVDPDITRI